MLSGCENSKEKNEIRAKYPLITSTQFALDVASFDFEELITYSPDIVEISVVEVLPDYSVNFIDEENEINSTLIFHQYKAKIISNLSDTKLNMASDGTIIICHNSMFDGSYPELSVGMNAICSLEAASGPHKGKYLFYNKAFYYVDNGLALAAYEGDTSIAAISCNKDELINKITSIRKQNAK